MTGKEPEYTREQSEAIGASIDKYYETVTGNVHTDPLIPPFKDGIKLNEPSTGEVTAEEEEL